MSEPAVQKGQKITALVAVVAKAAYELLADLPESEQWDLQSKIRREAVEAVATVGEGIGALDPRDALWRLGQARAHLTSLTELMKLARVTSGVQLDPEAMLAMNQALELIDAEATNLPGKAKNWLETAYPQTAKDKDI